MFETIDDLIAVTAANYPNNEALRHKGTSVDYSQLDRAVDEFAIGMLARGLKKFERVAIYSGKSVATVSAIFGTSRAGGVFVPVNPLLKPNQVLYLLNDCDVRVLVTTSARLRELSSILAECKALKQVILTDANSDTFDNPATYSVLGWQELAQTDEVVIHPRLISSDMAAIMYTSGSTGMPKGVILSHGNMTIGAMSVSSYLENTQDDRILAILPLSFDAGLSQLTTGFYAGATVVLHDHFLPRDVVSIVERERITGITAVPPLWMQLADRKWPDGAAGTVRYFANTGGKMPKNTLDQLRDIFPNAKPYLMYGLTESFRSTYLDPSEVDRRPDSIGKAIPNVEVLVAKSDGTLCGPNEAGELVHRGPLVSLGYWNDYERTARRFRPCPGKPAEIPNTELAVWSGDTVRADEDGFLYFVARSDDMIKTSGYRVSPTEIEEIAFDTGLVAEVAAVGVPHDKLGQAIVLVAKPRTSSSKSSETLVDFFKDQVPNYMVPHSIFWMNTLPRNANGKLDRKELVKIAIALMEESHQ